MTAALAAHDAGREVIVLENMNEVGGSTALSGGGFWIPNNPYMKACGIKDSYEDALAYMNEVIPEKGPASSKELREAYLKNAPEMVTWLEGLGFKGKYAQGYPDYYPECSGGCAAGRCVCPPHAQWCSIVDPSWCTPPLLMNIAVVFRVGEEKTQQVTIGLRG